jgi:hypothetical protein
VASGGPELKTNSASISVLAASKHRQFPFSAKASRDGSCPFPGNASRSQYRHGCGKQFLEWETMKTQGRGAPVQIAIGENHSLGQQWSQLENSGNPANTDRTYHRTWETGLEAGI